ncbi:hypothetical protein [Phenylobacterium montanum]|uniref:Uncharacterized protein n=1 Tax=Phenylobacterium montanum TaxID=2823693 RepID=A0A975G331_9CAUL|nr:hypothetical protein [Caulobacter sp. S6]QUD89899.1 hypothetical protein KCG34_08555 [Caulobacter sp. S6]
MFISSDLADPQPLDPAQTRALRHGLILQRLVEVGMTLLGAVEREALARAEAVEAAMIAGRTLPPPSPQDPGLSFSRISRAVRLTLALEARVAEGQVAQPVAAEPPPPRPICAEEEARMERIAERKAHAQEAVEKLIDAAPAGEAEALHNALAERLEDAPDEAEFERAPVSRLIERICADLGVEPDWDLWEDEPWARNEATRRVRGSPYARRRTRVEPRSAPAGRREAADDG